MESSVNKFSLVDKRQMVQNNADWNNHFILTFRKEPYYVCLNVGMLEKLSQEERIKMYADIEDYLGL